MGIPGILKEIGKGERIALTKLAIDHFEKTNRPLRIAVDAAIWNFQNAASQGGKNPALRTFFFRLLKLLALPIHPVFVYDGSNKPLTKRGKTVARYGTCIENEMAKQLLSQFKFPYHTAPGEAEAECAFLQKHGIVDAVMSQDVDAIMFGSAVTLRDWSKEGTYGNKTPTHVSVLDSSKMKERSGLDSDAMILVAMLSGGDYDDGVTGFGSSLACEVGKAGFGSDLVKLVREGNQPELKEWKERLQYELETNESGHFRRRHPKLKLPDSFPDLKILQYYMQPCVSMRSQLPGLEASWNRQWESEIDVTTLRGYTATMFEWNWRKGARRFVRCFAQPIFQDRLRRGLVPHSQYSCDSISTDRRHFITDGVVELRFSAIPAQAVGLDINSEDECPDFVASQTENEDDESLELGPEEAIVTSELDNKTNPQSPSKTRVSFWDPYATEKWWVPATLLKVGLGAIVEEWEQKQRDIMADPKKFATRKCAKPPTAVKRIDDQMSPGAIRSFLSQQRPNQNHIGQYPDTSIIDKDISCHTASAVNQNQRTPSKRRQKIVSEEQSPSITRFFRSQKASFPEVTCSQEPLSALKEAFSTYTQSAPFDGTTSDVAKFSHAQEIIMLDSPSPVESPKKVESDDNTSTRYGDSSNMHTLGTDISNHKNITKRSGVKSRSSRVQKVTQQKQTEPPSMDPFFHPTFDVVKTGLASEVDDRQPRAASKISKVTAIPRDSLPGTWKELAMEEQSRSSKARISFIDLTGD